jgi:hypothetical protein
MTTTTLLRQYRSEATKLANLEKAFDAYMRGHRDDEAARLAYAEKANVQYFAIKARMADIKVRYAMLRGANCGLVSVA